MVEKDNLPFSIDINLSTGLSRGYIKKWRRKLSDMSDSFYNRQEVKKILEKGVDPILYEVHDRPTPPESGQLAVATTIVYPGKIGDEYYMTKGHYHYENQAEMYLCLSGIGYLLLHTKEYKPIILEMKKGKFLYIPPNWAHRVINVGNEKLIWLNFYPPIGGHDYDTIEKEGGFKKIVIEKDNKPTVIDNPRYGKM